MKILSPVVLGLSFAVAGSMLTAAQETPSSVKVLQITREYTKPYKGGAAHDKTESAFVQAMTKAKFPAHYVALNAMSGRSRSLYLTRYDCFLIGKRTTSWWTRIRPWRRSWSARALLTAICWKR